MNPIFERDAECVIQQIDLAALSGKTVLILGTNGLIGSQLARVLYQANQKHHLGVRVIGISRSAPNLLVEGVSSDSHFTFLSQDLAKGFAVDDPLDYVIHCATYAQPKKFLAERLSTIKLNTELTERLLERCAVDKARFLFASSSDVYGQPDETHIPTPETYFGNLCTVAPRSAYGESKRLGETLCALYRETRQVDARIARISMVYGPGISIHDERVLGNFLKKALLDKHIKLLDKGQQLRTWCYITDCAVMLFKILLEGNDYLYNVAGRDTLAIRDLARMVCELTGADYTLPEATPASAKDLLAGADRVELDISKVVREFGLNRFVSMRDGLQNTVDWNRQSVLPQRPSMNQGVPTHVS